MADHLKYDPITGHLLRKTSSGHLIYDCEGGGGTDPEPCDGCDPTPTVTVTNADYPEINGVYNLVQGVGCSWLVEVPINEFGGFVDVVINWNGTNWVGGINYDDGAMGTGTAGFDGGTTIPCPPLTSWTLTSSDIGAGITFTVS